MTSPAERLRELMAQRDVFRAKDLSGAVLGVDMELHKHVPALLDRVAALEAALRGLLEMWDGYNDEKDGGWPNQEKAYYRLARSHRKDWEAARATLKVAP